MQHLATISSKYQVTLPSAFRKSWDLNAGDRIALTFAGNQLAVAKTKNFMKYSGALQHLVPTKPFTKKEIDARKRAFKKQEYEHKNQADR